jgi:DNA-binding FadR family transcriptional regulator
VERRRKLSEVVAEQLMEEIKARSWPVGESIGTESELMARFNVSRATIVEAARQVERHGAATMRRGSGGGLVVLSSAPAAAARAISTYLELSSVSIAELYEAVRVIETEAGKLAAMRMTEEGALELRALAASVLDTKDNVEINAAAMRLRITIAEATGNPSLALFMRSLARVLTDYVRPDLRSSVRDRGFEHGLASDMSAIVEAIVAGDIARTDQAIRLDVERREARARILAVAQPILEVGPLRKENASKFSEQIAVKLRNDILREGLRPGERLASEAQLPERYGVSQWVLRQAIRILELHGIVRMQRGQGGGLFVNAPSPAYSVEVAVSFLRGDVEPDSLLETRARLFQSIAQFAALRSAPDEHESLAALASKRAGKKPELFAIEPFLERLAEMGKNRVLALFGIILNRFIHEYAAPTEVSQDIAAAVAEAVSIGDSPLARRRTTALLQPR